MQQPYLNKSDQLPSLDCILAILLSQLGFSEVVDVVNKKVTILEVRKENCVCYDVNHFKNSLSQPIFDPQQRKTIKRSMKNILIDIIESNYIVTIETTKSDIRLPKKRIKEIVFNDTKIECNSLLAISNALENVFTECVYQNRKPITIHPNDLNILEINKHLKVVLPNSSSLGSSRQMPSHVYSQIPLYPTQSSPRQDVQISPQTYVIDKPASDDSKLFMKKPTTKQYSYSQYAKQPSKPPQSQRAKKNNICNLLFTKKPKKSTTQINASFRGPIASLQQSNEISNDSLKDLTSSYTNAFRSSGSLPPETCLPTQITSFDTTETPIQNHPSSLKSSLLFSNQENTKQLFESQAHHIGDADSVPSTTNNNQHPKPHEQHPFIKTERDLSPTSSQTASSHYPTFPPVQKPPQ
ncbi:hypothetical protein QTN25_006206 [Entamoeba marina]